MGICCSKKTIAAASSSPTPLPDPSFQIHSNTPPEKIKPQEEEETLKKETFIVKHRNSHEIDRRTDEEKPKEKAETGNIALGSGNGGFGIGNGTGNGVVVATPIRTSSCTKEEVDAILIQCGRLSRSSSTDNTRGRKYSGSKRSFDFDHEVGGDKDQHDEIVVDGGDEAAVERIHRHRQRHRDSRVANSSPHGRRRTPSRERDQQQQRSGSRERGGSSGSGASSGGGRRVSRSPGRRSESPITNSNGVGGTSSSSAGNANCRPGKMVSVPATVSSLVMDKSNNAGGSMAELPSATAVKRVHVKRNVGESPVRTRSAASPRARSPARTNVKASDENQNAHGNNPTQHQQPLSLSRSNSRKAEQSPYRRNPLSQIDNNVNGCEQPPLLTTKSTNNNNVHQATIQKASNENGNSYKVVLGTDNKGSSNKGIREQQKQPTAEEAKGMQHMTGNVAVTVIPSGTEGLKPQALTRSRSSRLSRDLDVNPETLLNSNPSYTTLLLEDINNFHQKSAPAPATVPAPAFPLPACVTKACSILEAVADLNSSTSSNLSCAYADDRIRNPITEKVNKNDKNSSLGANAAGKKRLAGAKDPIVESEVVASDDLMEPSFHKYVTMRRGAAEDGGDTAEQESSGSNSFVGSQQHWLSSSTWEPNSADSTGNSSRTNTRESDLSLLGLGVQKHGSSSECSRDMDDPHRRFSERKRISDNRQNGIGRGRVGSARGVHSMPIAAAAST